MDRCVDYYNTLLTAHLQTHCVNDWSFGPALSVSTWYSSHFGSPRHRCHGFYAGRKQKACWVFLPSVLFCSLCVKHQHCLQIAEAVAVTLWRTGWQILMKFLVMFSDVVTHKNMILRTSCIVILYLDISCPHVWQTLVLLFCLCLCACSRFRLVRLICFLQQNWSGSGLLWVGLSCSVCPDASLFH